MIWSQLLGGLQLGVKNIRSLHDGIGKCFENDLCELRVCKAWSLQAERPLKDQPIVYPFVCYTVQNHAPTVPHAPNRPPPPFSMTWRRRLSIIQRLPALEVSKPPRPPQAVGPTSLCRARRAPHNESGPSLRGRRLRKRVNTRAYASARECHMVRCAARSA